METTKGKILNNICYTDLVYERINKKLGTRLSKHEIEEMLRAVIMETNDSDFRASGKNIYVTGCEKSIRITINSNTYRVITVDRVTACGKQR